MKSSKKKNSPLAVSRRGISAALLASLAVAAPLRMVWAQTAPQGEAKLRGALVKAAFLHKFFSFVEWPDGTFARPDSPVRIGVIGDDEVFQDLSELAHDRSRDGRPVTVVRLAPGDSTAGIHILYVKATSTSRASDMLASVPEGVLTVADVDSSHPKGSVMSFFVEEDRIRFGVSLEAAAKQRLRLNSRLLSVARKIQGSLDGDAEGETELA